jgi:hypothetical protein
MSRGTAAVAVGGLASVELELLPIRGRPPK